MKITVIGVSLGVLLTFSSVSGVRAEETLMETCGHYHKFHGNRAAFDQAQKLAMIYECAVYGTEMVLVERYADPNDPRAKGPIDAIKAKARAGMEKRYPKIPDACLNGLLSVWYIVISDDSNASRTCIQAATSKEGDRQLNE